jgi:hypothetical protein
MNASQDDIRRLLRSFGIKADEVIQSHLANRQGVDALKLRVVLEDITDYGGTTPPQTPRLLEVEGEVRA